MNNSDTAQHNPNAGRPVYRGLAVSIVLGLMLLVLTALQTAGSLLRRLGATDVMKAAAENPFAGALGWQLGQFAAAQLLLHVAFGVIAWLLALATGRIWRDAARRQFVGLVVMWYCLLTLAVLAYNATWFPRSGSGGYYHALATTDVGPWLAGEVVAAVVALLAGCVLVTSMARSMLAGTRSNARARILVLCGFSALAVAGLTKVIGTTGAMNSIPTGKPNVILLGIDSLRLEQLQRFGGSGAATPHLDAYLQHADVIADATTPVARTFPSWLAILTGRSPRTTGGVFNLMQRDAIVANPTLADVLRDHGYRTVYATDEVRFAPIDESFGFDQVVTPPIGAADFIIGNFNDLPLANVVANTALGRWLFPYSHGNRGAAAVFQPETFLRRLDREIEFNGPTMLALHLTAAHWPYFISDTPPDEQMRPRHDQDRPYYMTGLKTADGMFGRVIRMLEDKGALHNAVVVVLSDHGEGLKLSGDSLVNSSDHNIAGALMPPPVLEFGHGQSVLSPVQYQVLMSYRTFGTASYSSTGRMIDTGATVEDIAPTVLEMLDLEVSALDPTGQSLYPVLRGDEAAARTLGERFRFTETDLQVKPGVGAEKIDEDATARESTIYFRVEPATGRLHMRPDAVHLLMNFKERAVFDRERILAALPATPDTHQYLLLDRETGEGRVLASVPEPTDVEAYRLWRALEAGFPGELKPPTVLRPEEVEATRQAWNAFLVEHLSTRKPSRPTGS